MDDVDFRLYIGKFVYFLRCYAVIQDLWNSQGRNDCLALLSTFVSFVLLNLADRKQTVVALKKFVVTFYKFLVDLSEQPVSFLYALRLNSKVGY